MKKVALVFVVLLLIVGCSNIVIRNEEGYRLFAYATFLHKYNVCVQTRDSFTVDGVLWDEFVGDRPFTVRNVYADPIELKVTDIYGSQYITLAGGCELEFPKVEE